MFASTYQAGGGTAFDISVGVKVWRQLAFGAGVSLFSRQDELQVTAQLPHPFHFDKPRRITGTAQGLTREETAGSRPGDVSGTCRTAGRDRRVRGAFVRQRHAGHGDLPARSSSSRSRVRQEQPPDPVHPGVSQGRRGNLAGPGIHPPIPDPGQRGEEQIAKIGEVRQPKDAGGELLPPGLPPASAQGALQELEQQLDQTAAQPVSADGPGGREQRADRSRAARRDQGGVADSVRVELHGNVPAKDDGRSRGLPQPSGRPNQLRAVADRRRPYTAQNPPQVLTFMALAGAVLPRTAFTYVNLGPTQQVGTELWVEQRISRSASAWFNYSWQDEPQIMESDNPYLSTELSLSPTHRVNVGASLAGSRFLGNASVSRATAAFWSDVLTPEYHGYSDGYTMVNGSFGVKWSGGAITTLIKVTNLFN